MIVVKISDGFGNQLFMYACGYAVAKRNHAELLLDTSILDTNCLRKYELGYLNLFYNKRITVSKYKSRIIMAAARKIKYFQLFKNMNVFEENLGKGFDKEILKVTDNTYISGYWQSEKYFSEYRADLTKQFVPKIERSESVIKLMHEIQSNNSVALHVRRGDYMNIGCQLDMGYYDKAIETIKSINPNKHFVLYVFSDDVNFCKEYFSKKLHKDDRYIELRYPIYKSDDYTLDDLFLMSKCNHIIMANSSYSWWAAWLNSNDEKMIICPEIGMWKGDYYPDDWLKISCD